MATEFTRSSTDEVRFFPGGRSAHACLLAIALVLTAILAAAWYRQPSTISDVYFRTQDVPVLSAMFVGAILFSDRCRGPRWEQEVRLSPRLALAAIVALVGISFAGHWLVMFGYDVSRDESMATLAVRQLVQGTLVTPVPAAWQPFGRAMLPVFYTGRIAPELVWTSGYLPVNSAFRALAGVVFNEAITNPFLYAIGLLALWKVARRIWPERRDAAVISVALGATSTQLIVTAMTSYAMIGHFALNMVWLNLFLRDDKRGTVAALIIGSFAMGLHQFHFHLMFAAPFLFWLMLRRQWKRAMLYVFWYAVMTLVWFKGYPAWLMYQAGPEAIVPPHDASLWAYVKDRVGRLLDYSPAVYLMNFARFFAWQNVLMIPLIISAWPLIREKARWRDTPLLPLAGVCLLGLSLMVYQGHGWGYRYLSGAIGCFCLVAGYGWIRLLPEPGPGRAWAMAKYACAFTIVLVLPVQLAMARSFVAPYAELYDAAKNADADVVLVDVEGGLYAQDLVQNSPDFGKRPMLMDLALVPADALARLCSTQRLARIDISHYRATGMNSLPVGPDVERRLQLRRARLERLGCAPPLVLRG